VYPLGDLWFGTTSKGTSRQASELGKFVGGQKGAPETFAHDGVHDAIARVAHSLREGPEVGVSTAVFIAETVTARGPVDLLQRAFTDYFDEVIFVMFARRQDKAAASVLSQLVKTPHLPDTNLDPHRRKSFKGVPFGEYNHLRNYQRWVTGPENYRLVVVPYLENEQGSFNSIERFYQAAGLGHPVALLGIEGRRIHPTFSLEGLTALVGVKKSAQRWKWIPGSREYFAARFREITRVYLESARSAGLEPSGRKFVPWQLSSEDARWVLDIFEPGNRELLEIVRDGQFSDAWDQWEEALA